MTRPYFIGRGQLGFCYAHIYAVHAVYLKDVFAVYLENVYAVHLEDEFAARHPFDCWVGYCIPWTWVCRSWLGPYRLWT